MSVCMNKYGDAYDLINCTMTTSSIAAATPSMITDNGDDLAIFYKEMVTDFVTNFTDSFEYNPWIFATIGSIFIGLSGIFPLLVISVDDEPATTKHGGAGASKLKVLLSFAVGGLLGDVFLHLLPEAWANDLRNRSRLGHPSIFSGTMLLSGMLLFIIVEKLFSGLGQGEDDEEVKNEKLDKITAKPNNKTITNNNNTKDYEFNSNKNGFVKSEDLNVEHLQKPKYVAGYLNLMANCIDNFTHGLAVGGSFLISLRLGALTTFAILIHEIPHEIGDFAILLKSGFSRWDAARAQIITAGGGLVGSLIAVGSSGGRVAVEGQTSWILPFTAGGFLHIALVTVLPDLLKEDNRKESIKQFGALILGICIMAALTYLE